jgi:hypothetical protein
MGRIVTELKRLRADRSLTNRSHIESLRRRHGSTTVCPKCSVPPVVGGEPPAASRHGASGGQLRGDQPGHGQGG